MANIYQYFAEKGSKYTRIRLWVNPKPAPLNYPNWPDLRSSNLHNVLKQFKLARPYF